MDIENDQPTAWQEVTGRLAALAGRSTLPSSQSHDAPSGLRPATFDETTGILTPCLQLVAPASMDLESQATWLDAASMALAEFPADLVRQGARKAMLVADHPSKIVPAIVAYAQPLLAARQRIERIARDAKTQALPAPGREPPTAVEADEICRAYGVGRYRDDGAATPAARRTGDLDPNRPCRSPTREDYLRMGVAPETLDRIAGPSDDLAAAA